MSQNKKTKTDAFNAEQAQKKLAALKLRKVIEKSDQYDDQIKTIENQLDFLYYGIKA